MEFITPVLTLLFLTFLVWVYMYFLRLRYVMRNQINPQNLSTPEQCQSVLPDKVNKPSNNFKNLFEVPVIFYVVSILCLITQQTDVVLMYLAWLFVAGRAVHSIYHCFLESVMAKFYAYIISTIMLWLMMFKLITNLIFL